MKLKIFGLIILATILYAQYIPVPTPPDPGGGGEYPKDASFDSITLNGKDLETELSNKMDRVISGSGIIITNGNISIDSDVVFTKDNFDAIVSGIVTNMILNGFTIDGKSYKLVIDNN